MPKTDSYSQNVRYPLLSDAPNIETDTAAIVNGIVPLTVMRFSNANARAAALSGSVSAKPGMVTYLVSEDRFDGRMQDGSWQALTPQPWKPLTIKSGFVARSGSPGYRVVNGIVHLRGRIERSNGGRFTTGEDWVIANIPAAVRPATYSYWVTPVEMGAGIYYARTQLNADTGDIMVQVPPGQTNNTGGLHWVGLDGCTFSL
ncbi:hypothetical protein ACH4OV_25250 [Streptomyces diastaticus]|uniref:hypothetical protein n=1 Tax=Streptomyces diastaticus TaxID=1956 RepID=UPI0037BD2095